MLWQKFHKDIFFSVSSETVGLSLGKIATSTLMVADAYGELENLSKFNKETIGYDASHRGIFTGQKSSQKPGQALDVLTSTPLQPHSCSVTA